MTTFREQLRKYTGDPNWKVGIPAAQPDVIPASQTGPTPGNIAMEKGKQTVEQETISNDFTPIANTYQIQPFTKEQEAQALKDAEQSTAFGLIMAERDKKMKEYQDRLNNDVKRTRALAWTNLFTNLAKLGGMGYAPVVKEDTTHMFKAFNDVDNVRNLMSQVADRYSSALTNSKLQYVESAKVAHNAAQKARYDANQKYVDAYNKAGMESRTKTKTKYEYDPGQDETDRLKREKLNAEIKQIQAREDLTQAQKDKIIREMEQGSKDKKPFYEFEHPDGYTYRISQSKAVDIVNYLTRIQAGEIDLGPTIKQEVEGDLNILANRYDADMKDAETLRIISKYMQKYPDLFRQFINSAQRTKTTKNNPSSTFVEDDSNMTIEYE